MRNLPKVANRLRAGLDLESGVKNGPGVQEIHFSHW
jgi:hypothetical protein